MAYGTVTIGRLVVRENFVLQDAVDASNGERSISLSGEEASPPLTLAILKQRAEDMMGMRGMFLPVVFTNKTDHNGYYMVADVSADITNWNNDIAKFAWTIKLQQVGADNNVDVESRLGNIARQNDFSNVGERWHAPSIGHYGYYTGATQPSRFNRISSDGTVIVYRGVPAVNPRWGSAVGNYMAGRSRIVVTGVERSGTNLPIGALDWEINNGLVRVTPNNNSTGYLNVSSWSSGSSTWQTKLFRVGVTSGNFIQTVDGATVLRNDAEMVTLRLTKNFAIFGEVGRATLDLTLRRGSRVVEGYLQRGDQANELKVTLFTGENYTNSSSGYVYATSNDVNGNKFVMGSARNFTPHASGGVVRSNTRVLDFFIATSVGGSAAVDGDQPDDLYAQYVSSSSEYTMGVRR